MTLTPAHGRDYKTKAEVLEAWLAGKDFLVADIVHRFHGHVVKRAQIQGEVTIRYDKMTQEVIVMGG